MSTPHPPPDSAPGWRDRTDLDDGITAVICAHPPRLASGMLARALASVTAQTLQPAAISVANDLARRGAWHTRQRALDAARTQWVAYLDSDDWWLPHHLERLAGLQERTGADMVYSWFQTDPPGRDPFPRHFFAAPWNPTQPRHTTMTIMVRTALAQHVGFTAPPTDHELVGNEDWRHVEGLIGAGAHIEHLPERTWVWCHRSGNTSGMPSRW